MGIVITNQTNEQECGVCALTTLHNHFYSKDKIDKQKVLAESSISNNGMTIFDFEVLGNKLGIECESYEVNWSEFKDLKINAFFVLLLSTNHYVIAQKIKNKVKIFDSCQSNPLILTYEQLQNQFSNVIILVNKKPNQLFKSTFKRARTLLMFDLKFIILNILLSLFLLLTSLLGARFLNWVIDLSITNNSIKNLLSLAFIFIFINISNDVISYITSLYCSGHLKTYCLLFTNKILSALSNKNTHLFNKVDKRWIYKTDECVFCLSNFCVIEINKLITNSIFSTICICVIGLVHPLLLIFALLIPIIQFLFFLFTYQKKKSLFIKITRQENLNTIYYKHLVENLMHEHWFKRREFWLNRLNNNYSSIYKNYSDSIIFKNNLNLIKDITKSVFEILLICLCAYLIIRTNTLTVGKLTFIIATFGLYKESTNGIFHYFLVRIEFDLYWQVYKDITEVANCKQEQTIIENEIDSLQFKNNELCINLTRKKENFFSGSIKELLLNSNTININETSVCLNSDWIKDNLIIDDENLNYIYSQFLSEFESCPAKFLKYIRHFNIDPSREQQSLLNTIVLNLLLLSTYKDKTIIIDKVQEYFSYKDQNLIKEIINKIKLENNVFIVRRDKYD